MKTINQLILEDKLEEAASMLVDNLLYIFNTLGPKVQLTKAEFAKVAPKFVEALQNADQEPEPSEETPEPGDDIKVEPSKGELVVTFTCEDDEVALPPTYTRTYLIGKPYKYTPPAIEGYTVSPENISGSMSAEGVQQEFTYTKAEG